MPGNDDDDTDFVLSDPQEQPKRSSAMEDTGEWLAPPLANMKTSETGAASTYTDAAAMRKLAINYGSETPAITPETHEYVIAPNEDAHTVSKITLDSGSAPEKLLDKVLSYVDASHRSRKDGATVSSALICEGKLYTANMGDSPVLVVSYDPSVPMESGNAIKVRQVTKDHVVSDPDERAALPNPELAVQTGATTWRVYEDTSLKRGLMLARAMGNHGFPINHTVDTKVTDLTPELQAGKELLVVVGSDGIMEGASVEKIERMLNLALKIKAESSTGMFEPDDLAYIMSSMRYSQSNDEVQLYSRNDDTTVIVQPVTAELSQPQQGPKKQAALLNVADGHGFQFERNEQGQIVFDCNNAKTAYDRPLSQVVVEEIQRYVDSPHLMRESKIMRQ